MVPLAAKIRPQSLLEVVGQTHILGENKPLKNIIDSGTVPNLIFFGPSGTGKTTVAEIIAKNSKMEFKKLNGTTATLADVKQIAAETFTIGSENGILLYLDEIQYFNKKQQQSLLDYIENGSITLIASTTENPYFYIHPAILSRCTVFEFKPVSPDEIKKAVERALSKLSESENVKITADDDVITTISKRCGGDVRKAVMTAELAFLACETKNGECHITNDTVKDLLQNAGVKFDKGGDYDYDTMSAYQKSMRGSDPDAALFYLAKLLNGGDLAAATRRLLVCACEDVGLAYPSIIPIVKNAVDIAFEVGLPEARIPLADATVLVAMSPKSNSAYMAYEKAEGDVRAGRGTVPPRALQNKHFDGFDNKNPGQNYKYAHDFKNHWVRQQYLPDDLKNVTYYTPGENKNEQKFWEHLQKIKE